MTDPFELLNNAVNDAFGKTVSYVGVAPDRALAYYNANGADAEITGVFDNEYYQADVGDHSVSGSQPMLGCKQSDIDTAGIKRRKTLIIDGSPYEISHFEPDTEGWTQVILKNG